METKIEILNEIFEPEINDYSTEKKDLQLAITLNPDVDDILKAMETYATQQTADLSTQLAKANSDKERLGELLKELHIELGERKAYPLEHGIYFMGEIEQTLQDCGITL
jgi:hypothetical protein